MVIRSKRLGAAASAALVATVLVGGEARADLFGGDVAVLSNILVQSVEQVQKLNEQLNTLRDAYNETHKLAGYADEAYQSYQHFAHYNAQLFGQDVTNALDTAFPDVAYFRSEAARGGSGWAQASGEMPVLVASCAAGRGGTCEQLEANITLSQTRKALASVFGIQGTLVDQEAAIGATAGRSLVGHAKVDSAALEALAKRCMNEGGSPAECQAAAQAAQIRSGATQDLLIQQTGQLNTTSALQLQELEAARQRQQQDADQRHQFLLNAVQQGQAQPARVKTDGFDLLGSGGGQ